MYDYESEIESLESAISNLNDVIAEIQDNPYFEYLKGGYEDDVRDMQQRLDELYETQNETWGAEMRYQNKQFEEDRL